MCGIVGYVGSGDALPTLMAGLEKLEYRGYDSAGVALISEHGMKVVRKAGELSVLSESLNGTRVPAPIGIAHTRWATHGVPSDENAHPHLDCTGKVAIVHNGIIENHTALRAKLEASGHRVTSTTDSEILAHLIEEAVKEETSLLKAVLSIVPTIEGAFAIACLSEDEPDRIVVARSQAPMVIGLGPDSGIVASDIPPLLAHTRQVVPLENEQVAEVTASGLTILDFAGREVQPEPVAISWTTRSAERAGFDDFMLKEILEQPQAVAATLRGLFDESYSIRLPRLHDQHALEDVKRIVVIACGSSFHAGLAGKQVIEEWARIPVDVEYASEFRYRNPLVDSETLVIAISQSGETADTLAGVQHARRLGARILGICNVLGSSLAREADEVLFTQAGPEIGVAATKTFLTQLVVLDVLGMYLAQTKRTLSRLDINRLTRAVLTLPDLIQDVLLSQSEVQRAAKRFADSDRFLFLGRGNGTALALEGALKLKEISYISAEGYPAGELKHGPIALVEAGVPVVALLLDKSLESKLLANLEEVRARGAKVIAIATPENEGVRDICDEYIEVAATEPGLAPAVAAVPLQLLSYFIAKERGLSPDKPRNLAKSVTVE